MTAVRDAPRVPTRLLLRVSRCGDRSYECEQACAFVILQRQQEMRFFAVHQAQTEERFLPTLSLVIPRRIDDLDLVQLTDRHDIVAKVQIADDHVEHDIAGREQRGRKGVGSLYRSEVSK